MITRRFSKGVLLSLFNNIFLERTFPAAWPHISVIIKYTIRKYRVGANTLYNIKQAWLKDF